MCFAAMPFGQKAPPGKRSPLVDFDAIAKIFRRAVEAEGLEYVRADLEKDGGFINRAMYERLLVAEYVVADVTFANANVMYEIGVRHGASARPTLLVGAQNFVDKLPFDFRSFRLVTYSLTPSGKLSSKAADALEAAIRERLREMKRGTFPADNPIMQVTAWRPLGRAEHEKIDVFLGRLKFAGEIGEQVSKILALPESEPRVDRLAKIERGILEDPSDVVEQLYTALLAIFLGYRELEAYDRMTVLFDRLPRDLQQTVVVREQYAFALNRRAEAAEKRAGKAREANQTADAQAARDEATTFRNDALRMLDSIPESSVTSETFGIRGRVYKGWADAEQAAGAIEDSKGWLRRAIDLYEEGFRRDLRDFYPGVNAVTLRATRDEPGDREAVDSLVPVVRFAVESAPPAKNAEERYWRAATKFELACVARDWADARTRRNDVIAARIPSKPWMLKTTADTLRRLRAHTPSSNEDARELDEHITALDGVRG